MLPARSLLRLGVAIRRLRSDRHMTQADLARAARVSRQWVIAVEQGKTNGLEIGLVMRVLDALDASLMVRDDLVLPDAETSDADHGIGGTDDGSQGDRR
jgi:transcriptional regulator with XRE-family HTH domain